VNLKLSGFEAMPDMLRIANREDPMLVANVQVRAAGTDSPLLICLPFGPLEKFFSQSGQQRPKAVAEPTGERRLDRIAVESSVRNSLIDVTATLPALQLSMRDIARLSPGYTVMTGLAPTSDVTVAVAGCPRFIGSAGRAEGQLAIRINDMIETGDDGRINANRRMATVATAAFDKSGQGGNDINLVEMEPGAGDPAAAAGLSSLFHLSLPITIELGRARLSVQEVLELGRGSVIQLDRLVGEPVDIIVGDRRFAEGEVVVLGEQFGVRITRVIATPSAA
jgi:flagellar motor switch protein FliN